MFVIVVVAQQIYNGFAIARFLSMHRHVHPDIRLTDLISRCSEQAIGIVAFSTAETNAVATSRPSIKDEQFDETLLEFLGCPLTKVRVSCGHGLFDHLS